MTEYIERGELIIGLQKDYDAIFGRKPDFYNGYQIACRFVENFQTADVVPVRYGRWEFVEQRFYLGGFINIFRCSECKCPADREFNYCPHCGAKMEEAGGDDHDCD